MAGWFRRAAVPLLVCAIAVFAAMLVLGLQIFLLLCADLSWVGSRQLLFLAGFLVSVVR